MKVRNLVQNGSFETGNATGWTITDPAATVASGTASHQQFALKYANCTDGKVDKTWQKVTVLTNTDYVFRYSINRPQKLSGNLKAQLTMGPVIRYTYREASAGWKTETVRFNSGTNTSVIIELYADGTFTDTIYLDDIILAPAKTIVPNVTGLMQSAAETSLIAAGCTVGTVSGGYVHGAQPGTVLAQSPVSGQGVLLDTAVDLLVMETIAPSASATWISGTGSSDWAASQNWSGGTVPERETQVRFIGTGASECVLTNAVTVRQLVVGDEGSTSTSSLRLKAGTDLYCGIQSDGTGTLTTIGYAYPSTLIVETNALFSTHSNLWIAFSGGNSSLLINGGQVAVASTLHLGSSSNSSRGLITVDGSGQLSCAGILVHNTDVRIDILQGTILLDGNQLATVSEWIRTGILIGYEGFGWVSADYNQSHPGKTTIIAHLSPPPIEIIDPHGDDDGDGLSNLAEYATGQHSQRSLSTGAVTFTYPMRTDDPHLIYTVETTTNLLQGAWTSSTPSIGETNSTGGVYDEVTRTFQAASGELYIRLKIELQ